MIGIIVFWAILSIFVVLTFRTVQQIEYLLVTIKGELKNMVSKADLDAAIAGLNQAITDEAATLQTAIDALAAQIAAGNDLTAEVAAIQAAQARIAALPTTPTPPAP